MSVQTILLCFLNERQFKAGFVKKFKLKDGSVPIIRDPDALPEVVSLTLYSIYIFFFNDYLLITLALPREGWGEQKSLSRKEICTETSRCEWSCF